MWDFSPHLPREPCSRPSSPFLLVLSYQDSVAIITLLVLWVSTSLSLRYSLIGRNLPMVPSVFRALIGPKSPVLYFPTTARFFSSRCSFSGGRGLLAVFSPPPRSVVF